MVDKKHQMFADFEDPTRCSLCREDISAGDREKGLVLHVKVAPVWALHPETGQRLGQVQPDGPKNRYLHARPCAEKYAGAKLVCDKCNAWRAKEKGGSFCLCRCHPPTNDPLCRFHDTDLERAGGK
jgi:hypothetical protein